MARSKSKILTDGELRIMQILWEVPGAPVKVVAERLRREGPVAYNTVQTMMGILVEKGYLARRKDGRAYLYEPRVSRAAARAAALKRLVGQFFGGSREALVHSLLEGDALDAGELAEVSALLRGRSDTQPQGPDEPVESRSAADRQVKP